MKLHHFYTLLSFGQHEGETIAEAFKNNPTYPEWCYGNIDDFYVTDAVWNAMDVHNNLNDALKKNGIDPNEVKGMIAKNKKFHEEKRAKYKSYKMDQYSKKIEKELLGN